MADQHTSRSSESHASPASTRRRFLQGSGLTAAGYSPLWTASATHASTTSYTRTSMNR